MKLKKKIILGLITFCVSLIMVTNVNASEDGIELVTNAFTTDYIRWQKLSDDEKKKVIQPMPFSVNIPTQIDNQGEEQGNLKLKASVYQTRYSLKDDINLIVRDQKNTDECWAFTTTNLIATNLEKLNKSNEFKLFSTRHMNYTTSLTFLDGINSRGYNREVSNGGNCYIGLNYCTAGYGPILEAKMPFENNANKIYLSEIQEKNAVNKVNDYIQLPAIYKKIVDNDIVYYNGYDEDSEPNDYKEYTSTEVENVRKKIKQHIINYGAVSAYNYVNGSQYFDSSIYTAKSYYCNNDNVLPNHAVTIVGWDDEYDVSNFNKTNKPKNKGAYIVLNSHGENIYDGGYMYVSYDDVLIERNLLGVVNSTTKDYDNIYQYDELGYSSSITTGTQTAYIANVFDTKNTDTEKRELLNEVSFYVPKESKVEIYANVSDDDKTKLTLIKSCGQLDVGYHTAKLTNPIAIEGNKFVIAVKYKAVSGKASLPAEMNFKANNMGSDFWDTATGTTGQSYYSKDGTAWIDLSNKYKKTNFCVKAFTTIKDVSVTGIALNKENLSLYVNESQSLIATISPTNAKNKNVSWSSSNTQVATVSNNGVVKAIKAGTATITAKTEDGSYIATCLVTVKEKEQQADEKNSVGVTYQAHVQNIGWQNFVKDGEVAGTSGKSYRVEALKINLENAPENGKITYQSHVQNIGWQDWVSNGELTGTSGKSYRVEALKIKLENMPNYTVQYRVHIQDIGWQDWKEDGEMAGTSGRSLRIEAIQIRILKKCSMVTYQAHVQNIGWQNFVNDGEVAGTSGKSYRVEALKINLENAPENGKITYQSHVQNIGWQDWVSNGELTGTSGKSYRVEALKIKLENMPNYTVQYRVHIQDIGWQDWKEDGEMAGTSGRSLRIEAIQIRILEKRNV